MNVKNGDDARFEALRPRLLALLALHRSAKTDAARAAVVELLEETFLSAACHIAEDLLENGWSPGFAPRPARVQRGGLRLVGGTDAA